MNTLWILLLFSHSFTSSSLRPCELQHTWSLSFTISWILLKLMSFESVTPSNHLILSNPPLLPSVFSSIRVFLRSRLFTLGGLSIIASASASVLSMNIQDWFPLGFPGWISLLSKGISRVFSNTTVQKHQFLAIELLYGPTLTSLHDYWKNHSFDYMDFCWQSNVSAF